MDSSKTEASFGSRNSHSSGPSAKPTPRAAAIKQRSIRNWKLSDLVFYTLIGCLGMATIGFAVTILEDPEERQARLVEEATAEFERKREQARLDRIAERERATSARKQAEAERLAAKPPLKLISSKCRNEFGFIKYTGEVINRSKQPIDNLMAVGVFRTSNGGHVKSANALVDFQPLMPGQRSPFTIITGDNPAISDCFLAFKTMFGGVIAHE